MQPLALSEVALATGGQLHGEDRRFSSVSTDSRRVSDQALFVALQGERFDGNDYVGAAAEGGARAALVSREPTTDIPHVLVGDSRFALGQVAALNRQAFDGPLVAITGSSGKTSCKEMLTAIFARAGSVLATEGNLNNEIGVPLTLLRLAPEHEYAVIEMGASALGDIRYLCDFAHPTVSVLTNAQSAHLEGFGSLENVARTKGEIYEALRADGTAVINFDDGFCELWQTMAADKQRLFFSIDNSAADVYARDLRESLLEGQHFTLVSPAGEIDMSLPLLGRHMVGNALAAAAAALAVGVSLDVIRQGLADVRPVQGRLFVRQSDGVLVIDDSYNANPGSVRAAIDVLKSSSGRRHLVLGHMAELGERAEQEHRDIAAYASESGICRLWLVGAYAPAMAAEFGEAAEVFESREALGAALLQQVAEGDVLLVKGSRSAGMEQVVTTVVDGLNSRGEDTAC